ncbi:hypothetical protein DFP93_102148 [Aneurinibacillus soli]|uniref:Uncharacterized protein n=1 Tax=Aneurinibacillus soli TaxID=1500254 RepID=A0A0U4NFT9_9BACL|nr:hypothetical protein [Aneurinibacillus soli]PYE63464.1 hypothetical protein DFP93_102148 [Aneurinibacillus soli]BAU27604.1 hypothetical protein CB4_01778 [Aneurinibacillus soli]
MTEEQRTATKMLLANLSSSLYDKGFLAGMKDMADIVGIDMNAIIREFEQEQYGEEIA